MACHKHDAACGLPPRLCGPGGSHWNAHELRCEVTLAWVGVTPDGARVDLLFGQRKPVLVGRVFVVPPTSEAPGAVPAFIIPGGVVVAELRRRSRQKGTGADVYLAHAVLEVRPTNAQGKLGKHQRRKLSAEFAFGE